MRRAVNPYLPSYEYVPDAEPHIFGDRIYVYGSHDQFDGANFCLNNYVCWSAPVDDLSDWRYEGEIYDRLEDPACKDDANRLYAPDVVRGKNGRYYLFYALCQCRVLSVAVCDTPCGKFEFYGHVKHEDGSLFGSRPGDGMPDDPGVFIDDDGTVYLYTGFCIKKEIADRLHIDSSVLTGAMVSVLDADMLTIIGDTMTIVPNAPNAGGTGFEGHAFFEAASMRKKDDLYYFIYCSENSHELCYATSSYPDKGFEYRGVIISNGDIGYEGRTDKEALNYIGNIHGSIIEVNGQWMVFYHRHTNGHMYSRQGCAEKISIGPDGAINQAEMTSFGPDVNDKLPGKGTYGAGIAANLSGSSGTVPVPMFGKLGSEHPRITQDRPDGDTGAIQYIAMMGDGSWAGYKYFDLSDISSAAITLKGCGKGEVEVLSGNRIEEAKTIAILPVDSEGADDWETLTYTGIAHTVGKAAIYIRYHGTGMLDIRSFTLS